VDDVLAAAAQVFEEVGYAGGTTNRIAQRAGVSIGTLYQYFPNKEALAVALLERHLARARHHFQEWVAQVVAEPHSLRETLRRFVEGMLALHSEGPRLQHVFLEETPLPPRIQETVFAFEKEAVKLATGLLRLSPQVRHPCVQDASMMAVQAVKSLTHHLAAHPDQGLPREVFAGELVRMLEAYLTRDWTER
jgi:AcrR family transcriptional regulator